MVTHLSPYRETRGWVRIHQQPQKKIVVLWVILCFSYVMKSLPILLALGCLIFTGCQTVQKVAETQSAQIPEADEEPLGGNFLIKFVNPMNGAEVSPELRLNEESEGFSGAVIFPRGESPLKNVVLESDGSVTAIFTISGYSFNLKAVIDGDNIEGEFSGPRKISFSGSRLD
jgi:hypothetical protein